MKNSNIAKDWTIFVKVETFLYRFLWQPFLLRRMAEKNAKRFLEIGPGDERIQNFETVNLIKTPQTDYIADVSQYLPFGDETFDVVYASHVLEHTPWYQVEKTFAEWTRTIKRGGSLEIWVPDALKIAKAFCDAESGISAEFTDDNWFRFNDEKDPLVWFAGRIFSYGDGNGTKGHFNWHLAVFSERYLTFLFKKYGFRDIRRMDSSECRGYDHRWINLGIRGTRK